MNDHELDILYRDDPGQNPCTFKGICQHCTKVNREDRPVICQQLECPSYKPCPQCHNNRDLDELQHICAACIKENAKKKAPSMSAIDKAIQKGKKTYPDMVPAGVAEALRQANSAVPYAPSEFEDLGVAPDVLSEREKKYFQQRWGEYEGYYRDPSAYFIIHSMILAEIASRRTETEILKTAGELHSAKIQEKKEWLDYIALLKRQLPEREAQSMNDAESALNHIYNTYIEQKHLRHNGHISRIFSPEAVAIAPKLLFKPDLKAILLKMDYKIEDVERALQQLPNLGNTPEDALKALGFDLEERFAMPYEPDAEYGEPGEEETIEFNEEDSVEPV